MPNITEIVERIAKHHFGTNDDFIHVSVESARQALTDSYRHGQADNERLAILTQEESSVFSKLVQLEMDDDEIKARRAAWRKLTRAYPRLKKFNDAL